jgi:hypothetical protein
MGNGFQRSQWHLSLYAALAKKLRSTLSIWVLRQGYVDKTSHELGIGAHCGRCVNRLAHRRTRASRQIRALNPHIGALIFFDSLPVATSSKWQMALIPPRPRVCCREIAAVESPNWNRPA